MRVCVAVLYVCLPVVCSIAQQPFEKIPCAFFPPDNVWNIPINRLPVDANSDAYIRTIGAGKNIHPDYMAGLYGGAPVGIPFVIVPGNQPKLKVEFRYRSESDPGPYPIPADVLIEQASDAHALIVDRDNCILYELFSTKRTKRGWTAGSGAIFDLKSNKLRPAGWTSADAAGLPILPGLVRYDEVAAGEIRHALRFTAPETRDDYVWPARHEASNLTDKAFPPMGQRFRLKASYDISRFSPEAQVVLRALKKYGMILADNGGPWYISGVPDTRWDNEKIFELKRVHGSDLEAVDEMSLIVDKNSGRTK